MTGSPAVMRSLPGATADSLRLRLLAFQPVPGPLLEVAERGQVAHAVHVNLAVQVIRLVLEDPREEILRHQLDPFALSPVRLEPHRRVSRGDTAEVRDGQAALPVRGHLVGYRRH